MESLARQPAPQPGLRYETEAPFAAASDEDIDALLATRMGQDLVHLEARLERLEMQGWLARSADDYPTLTARGLALLRRWLS